MQAIGVSAQQNTVVPLDAQGNTVRPALVGGDKRAQVAAADLVDRLGSREAWAEAVGSVPQAALPVTKLRWLARSEPENAEQVAALMQAHDWLVWQLLGRPRAGPPTAAGPPAPATGQRRAPPGGPIWWSWRSGTRWRCRR